jgi:hypothetical protein
MEGMSFVIKMMGAEATAGDVGGKPDTIKKLET